MRRRVQHFYIRKRAGRAKPPRKRVVLRFAFVTVAVIVLIVVGIHMTIRPVIKTITGNQARILATSLINKAVLEELTVQGVQYDNLVELVYDAAGNIAALESNALALNRLHAVLSESINCALATMPNQDVHIPLGTLTGWELLSGRGPNLKLKMVPSSYIESAMRNNFDAAGINQTRHQILLDVTVTVSAILVPYTTTIQIHTVVVVAETIIVGTVPDFFASGISA